MFFVYALIRSLGQPTNHRTIQHEAEYLLIQNFEYILNGDGKQAQNKTFLKKDFVLALVQL